VEPIKPSFHPSVLHNNISAFDPAQIAQPSPEAFQRAGPQIRTFPKESNARDFRRLLRDDRPCPSRRQGSNG